MLSHLPCLLNLTFDDMLHDDVSMDSFIKTIAGQTDEPGLDAHDSKTDAFFNWWFAPVEICTDDCTDSENCTAACTNLKENVQYKELGILNSNQLFGIQNLDSSSTNPTVFSTGNAPKNLHVHTCYMAEALEPESESISRKKEINSASSTSPTRNLTPVTIMVADTIVTVWSRWLLKILLDSGSTTTLINKKCLPRKCQVCPISQNRMVKIH